MAEGVGAPRHDVWRALTDPAEIVRWDDVQIALVGLPTSRAVR